MVVLTSYGLGELMESFQMLLWTSRLALTPTTEPLQLAKDPESLKVVGIASGVSIWYKRAVYLFVFTPKAAIGAMLWWWGGVFIVQSPDTETLIRNTVMAVFVLQIDKQLFKVTVPEGMVRWIENLPRIPLLRADPSSTTASFGVGTISWLMSYYGQWLNFAWIAG